MALKMDDWKVKKADVEKVHLENESARKTMRDGTEARDAATTYIRNAHKVAQNQEKGKTAKPVTTDIPAKNQAKQGVVSKPTTTKTDFSPPVKENSPKVSQNVSPSNVHSHSPRTPAASSYVSNPPKPQLADLLIKGSSTPPTPPDATRQKATKVADQPKTTIERPVEAKVVVGPQTLPQGSQTADATRKETSEFKENPKGEKKSEGKKAKGGAGALAAQGTGRTTNEKLEAASSGVTSGGQELENSAGILHINAEGNKIDESHAYVKTRHVLYRGVIKSIEQPNTVEGKANPGDEPEVDSKTKGEIALRKNVYGVTNG